MSTSKRKAFGEKLKSVFTRREDPPPPAHLSGHILTEACPTDPDPAHLDAPNLADFERTADAQRQSPFLRLPIEVRRRIYDNVWEDAGHVRHIYVKDGRYTHTARITKHNGPDERQEEVHKAYYGAGDEEK